MTYLGLCVIWNELHFTIPKRRGRHSSQRLPRLRPRTGKGTENFKNDLAFQPGGGIRENTQVISQQIS